MANEIFLPIADMDAWESFWRENRDALQEIGDKDSCLTLAKRNSLLIGGGASPLFRVGFID